MKHIYTFGIEGDDTAAFLYWDEDRNINKLIVVNNKKLFVEVEFDCKEKNLKKTELGSYETIGIYVEDWMKEEWIWVYLTYSDNRKSKIGYCWNTGTLNNTYH